MTTSTAKALGYLITHKMTPAGMRWFVEPIESHIPESCLYGTAYASPKGALADVERRVAYRLNCSVEELRVHLERVAR